MLVHVPCPHLVRLGAERAGGLDPVNRGPASRIHFAIGRKFTGHKPLEAQEELIHELPGIGSRVACLQEFEDSPKIFFGKPLHSVSREVLGRGRYAKMLIDLNTYHTVCQPEGSLSSCAIFAGQDRSFACLPKREWHKHPETQSLVAQRRKWDRTPRGMPQLRKEHGNEKARLSRRTIVDVPFFQSD